MRLDKLSLKAKLAFLSAMFVCGMTVFAVVAFTVLNEVKIGGQMYSDINVSTGISGDFDPPRRLPRHCTPQDLSDAGRCQRSGSVPS